ncbi:MAG: NADH-quinone oxidoreductase subunit NuoG [Capsulimonas sp.]|uniref:NADH-quinone oxidoreductase subunit NuoG n=1 Tax=Capsulimonas sp. TaxID=2494211 RepID=UPI00326768E1
MAETATAPETTPAVELVNLTIDGTKVSVPKGTLVITAAFEAGADIPYFCHHPRLKPAGACRMCLVKIEKMNKIQTACTVPVAEGMVVDTISPEVKQAQSGILEFLLINHPLDCPVCDRGGECPLQNMTFQYGPGVTRFVDEKRHFPKAVPISDYVVLDRERCIQCARCTRFTEEISGDGELAIESRGNTAVISPFTPEGFKSKFSGNTIELCPVGALTSRTYRFAARPWEFQSQDSICSMCGVGCSIAVQTRNGELMRVNARLNEEVNEEWTCDRGKFEQYWVNSTDRINEPHLRMASQLRRVTWGQALDAAAKTLKDFAAVNPNSVAGIASPRCSNEDLYLFQRLFRNGLGTNNLDHRTNTAPYIPMQTSIAEVGTAKTIVAVGAEIDDVLPVLWLRVYKAISKGNANYFRSDDVKSTEVTDAIALGAGTVVLAWHNIPLEDIEALRAACAASGAKLNLLLPDANSVGAINMGVLPDRLPALASVSNGVRPVYETLWGGPLPAEPGLDTRGILEGCANGTIKALYLMGPDPLKNFADQDLVKRALDKVPFLIVQDLFNNGAGRLADVFLPSCSFIEKEGTFTNIEGRIQKFKKAIEPRGQSKPDWQIAADLLVRLGKNVPYISPRDIAREIAQVAAAKPAPPVGSPEPAPATIIEKAS